MGVFELDLLTFPGEVTWQEFYPPEEGAYQQGIAKQVMEAGLEQVRVEVSEEPDWMSSHLRRVTYTATEPSLGLQAFQRARTVRPQRGESWQQGEREAAVTEMIQRHARLQSPRG